MTNEHLWICIESAAAAMDGDRDTTEEIMGQLEQELIKLPPNDLAKLRESFVVLIGGLSRLEMRLAERFDQ